MYVNREIGKLMRKEDSGQRSAVYAKLRRAKEGRKRQRSVVRGQWSEGKGMNVQHRMKSKRNRSRKKTEGWSDPQIPLIFEDEKNHRGRVYTLDKRLLSVAKKDVKDARIKD